VSAPADRRAPYGAISGEQQAQLDRAAGELGVSVLQLMEVAGWQVARWLHELAGDDPVPVTVVAGSGNNGGDGMVAARHLATWGHAVEVHLVADPDRLGELPGRQLAAARAAGVAVRAHPAGDLPAASLRRAALVVDALLGTGVRGDPRPAHAEAIARLPPERTVAIDVPSGLDASSGAAGRPCVRAARTCTLAAMKAGLWSGDGPAHAGEITVADIGIPAAAWAAIGLARPALVRGGVLLSVPRGLLTGAAET
jgi:hydroxyethylthiazole kinase-like uncharacterized protein yjeF